MNKMSLGQNKSRKSLVIRLFLLLFVISACQEKKQVQTEFIKPSDTISFKVNDVGRLKHVFFRSFHINDTLWLTLLNPYNFKIHVQQYQPTNKEVINSFSIQIPKECMGRHGLNSFYIQNRDSIFVAPKGKNQVFLINAQKGLVKNWTFRKPLKNGNKHYKIAPNKLKYYKSCLYGRLYRDYANFGSAGLKSKIRFLYEFPSHFQLSIVDSTLKNPFSNWPSYVKSNSKVYYEDPKFLLNKRSKKIAFLFQRKPIIQSYDLKTGKQLDAKKFDFEGYKPGLTVSAAPKNKIGLKSSAFTAFEKDFNNHNYYAYYQQQLNFNNKQVNKSVAEKKKEILVFDKSFEMIKRLKVKHYKQFYPSLLAGKNGFFLIQRNHNEKFSLAYFSN